MSDLTELYQEVILDHTKSPRNFGNLEKATHIAEGHNPLCGDQVIVFLEMVDGWIKNIRFEGKGCAISTASASMMTEVLKGKSPEEIYSTFELFHDLVTGKPTPKVDELGKLAAFAGVAAFPVRVKCATLAWHTVKAALKKQHRPVTTE